jgi:hypothetical protein
MRYENPIPTWARSWLVAGLALCLSLGLSPAALGREEGDEEEIELERTLTLEARLLGVETVPVPGSIAIARFRLVGGGYDGSILSLAYDYARPVRLRSWDVHDASGYHRIGGAVVTEPAVGQWDHLLREDSHQPVHGLVLTLTQHDLHEDEKDRRWHFTRIESIEPAGRDPAADDPNARLRRGRRDR